MNQEASATIAAIKQEVGNTLIDITFKNSNKKPRLQQIFQQQPGMVSIINILLVQISNTSIRYASIAV